MRPRARNTSDPRWWQPTTSRRSAASAARARCHPPPRRTQNHRRLNVSAAVRSSSASCVRLRQANAFSCRAARSGVRPWIDAGREIDPRSRCARMNAARESKRPPCARADRPARTRCIHYRVDSHAEVGSRDRSIRSDDGGIVLIEGILDAAVDFQGFEKRYAARTSISV